jgi:hypothetical protein
MPTSARPIAKVLKPTTIVEDVGNDERTAVIVCHGMGQQIRWQTLCELASSLTRAQVVKPGSDVAVRQIRFQSLAEHVPLGTPRETGEPFFLGRAEATLQLTGGNAPARDVHIYEAYWAPLTEGRISLAQTIKFLVTTGVDGIRHSFRPIARYDGVTGVGDPPIVEKPRPYRNVLWSFSILLILLAVITMNAAISVAQLQWLLRQDDAAPRALLAMLTGDLFTFELMLIAAFLLFQGALAIRRQARHRSSSWRLPGVASGTLWAVTAGGAVFSVFVGLLIIPAHYWAHQSAAAYAPGPLEQALLRWPTETVQQWIVGLLSRLNDAGWLTTGVEERPWRALQAHALLVWGVILLASMRGRRLLVEYVGDVAIYVTAHTLSTFDQIRDDIKALVRRIVCAIYQQGRYERVVIVGHSLGSLIAYDALNATMLADSLSGAYGVQRTRRFVTFGSPLDKTAFFFRAVDAVRAPFREGLAASVQPMLIYRPSSPPTFDWINLYSPHDIISGKLDLYPAVDNRPDPQADTPLWAHVQFWSNELLARTIAEACVDHPAGWPPGKTDPRYEVAAESGIGMAVRGV